MKDIGIALHYAQGDFKSSSYLPELLESEVDDITSAFNGTGEVTVTGYSVVKREDPAPTIPEGTAKKLAFTTINLKSADDLTVCTLQGKFPTEEADKTALATVAKSKTVAGIAIDKMAIKVSSKDY